MGATRPDQPSGRPGNLWSRVLRGVARQFPALLVSGFGPSFTAGFLAVIAYGLGRSVSSPYFVGAAVALIAFGLGWAIVRLTRTHLWPRLRAIRAGLQKWIAEDTAEQQQRKIAEQQALIRSHTNYEYELKSEIADQDRMRERLEGQERAVRQLEEDHARERRRLRQEVADAQREIVELTPFAELGKNHILASNEIVGWLTYLQTWPEGVTPLERTTDFIADHFRPGLARVFPSLRRCGMALIAAEAGTYRLVCEELAPEVIRAIGPKPVRHGLETCLDRLGVADFVIMGLPDVKRKDHSEWLVLFARAEQDPTFDLMMSAGTKVLSLSRGV